MLTTFSGLVCSYSDR